MANKKIRTCQMCKSPFQGRKDAKTCSPACRKRLQRRLRAQATERAERLESVIGHELHRLAAELMKQHVLHQPLVLADERGAVAVPDLGVHDEPQTAESPAQEVAQPSVQPVAVAEPPAEPAVEPAVEPAAAEPVSVPVAEPITEPQAESLEAPTESPTTNIPVGVVSTPAEPTPTEPEEPAVPVANQAADVLPADVLPVSVADTSDESLEAPPDSAASFGSAEEPPVDTPKRARAFSPFGLNRAALLVTSFAMAVIAIIGIGSFTLLGRQHVQTPQSASQKVANYGNGKDLPLGNVTPPSLQVGQANNVSINGQLKVANTLVLEPGNAPNQPTRGQIYYDQGANAPFYYNGSQFVSLAPTQIGQHVNSIGGASGVVDLGNGLTVVNNQLSVAGSVFQEINSATAAANGGVRNLYGTANQVNVSGHTGNIMLSLPQDIATSSTPTFAGLNLGSPLTVANGGTGVGSLTTNGILYGNGTGAIQATASAASSVLVTNASGVPSLSQSLPLTVQNNITQTGALIVGSINNGFGAISTNNNITTSALIQAGSLEVDGGSFTVDNSGNFIAYGTGNIQGSGGLTLGVAGTTTGSLVLADSGSVYTTTVQAISQAGQDQTIIIPASSVASDQVCLLYLGNCTGSGSGVTSVGTQNYIAKFSNAAANQVGNSLLYDNGTSVGVNTASPGASYKLDVNGALHVASTSTLDNTLNVTAGGASIIGNISQTGTGTLSTGTGAVSLNGATSVTGTNTFSVGTGTATFGGALNVTSGLTTLSGGLSVVGATNINVSGTANTSIGNATGTFGLTSSGLNVSTGGALSGVTGYTQSSGNFAISGTGTFSTGTGTVSLNGATTVAGALNVNGGSLTVGVAGTTVGNIYLANNSSTRQTILRAVNPSGTGDAIIQFPSIAGGSTDTVCLQTLANCSFGTTAGGDLTGTYPNPTIAKLQGTTLTLSSLASGDVLQYNGTAVVNGHITNSNLTAGTFSNITGTGALSAGSIASGFGTISTANNITTSAALQGGTLAAGSSSQFQVNASGNVSTSGTINGATISGNVVNGQTISSSASFTGTLAVQGASLTVGTPGPSGTSGTLVLANGTNANLSVLSSSAPSGTGNATYNLPSIAGGSSDTICLSGLANCAGATGAAGGDLTGNYPNPTVAKLQGATLTLGTEASGDILQYNGTAWVNNAVSGDITINGSGVTTIGNGVVTNAKLANSSLTVTAGTGLSGGGAVSLGGSTSLSVVYGSSASTAAEGNTALSFTGSGNLTGTVSGTAGGGFTTNTLAVVNNPTFTTSVTTPQLNVTKGANTISITSAVQANDIALSIPADTNLTDTICLQTLGNCSFGGSAAGGDLTGTYPNPTIAKLQGTTLTLSSLASGDVLQYNGTAIVNGHITNSNLTAGTFSNITGTGALTTGSIASGFGTISTANNITTSATVQGGTVNATSAIQLGGTDINTAGTLSNVAYLNATTTNFTGTNLQHNGNAVCDASNNCNYAPNTGGTGYINNGTTVQTGANYYIRSGAIGSVGAIIEGANGQTANLLNLNSYNGTSSTTVASFDASGNLTAANFSGSSSGTNTGDVTLSGQNYLSLSGQVLTANAINLNSSNVTSTLQVGNGGTGSTATPTNGQLLIGNGTGYTAASLGTTGLTATTGSGSLSLAVNYGSAANTAAQGNTALSFTGSGNLTGTVSGTAGGGFTSNTLDTVANPTFGTSVTTPLLKVTNGANTISISSAAQANDVALSIPTDANLTDTICLETLGNCAGASGAAGGDLTGTYPNPTIAKLQGTTLTLSSLASGDVLQYNGTAIVNGHITNSNLTAGTFSNITGTGALSAGSIASGFGTISTTNNITTTATVQGGTVNATGTLELGGTDINTAGTLSNVAYLNATTTNFTGTNLEHNGNAVCDASNNCNYAPASGGNYIAKNAHDTSSASYLGNLLDLTNSNTGAAGVLSLTNAGTNSALNVTTTANPTSGQAVIFASNTNASPSGNLIDLQAGSSPTSKFSVDASGNVTAAGTINGATITSTTFNTANITGGTLSGGNFSGGSVSGGTLSATAVNGLNVSSTAISATGALSVASGGSGALTLTSASGDISTGSTINGQTISSSANFTGTLAVQGASVAIGTAGPSGTTGSVKLYNSTNANALTLQAGATASNLTLTLPTADGSNGDCLQTNGSGVLSFQTCTGGAGGGVTSLDGLSGVLTLNNSTGSGSAITIDNAAADGSTKGIATFNSTNFTASSGVVNTIQDINTGATPTFAGLTATGANSLTLGTAGPSGNTGSIAFKNSTNANTLTLQSGATAADLTLTLPTADGSNGDCLQTNGSGVLSFQTCTGGAGGGVTSLDGLTGVLTLANSTGSGSTVTINNAAADGTTKGIATFNSTNFSASSGVVNTIQDIATTSSPTFNNLTATGTVNGATISSTAFNNLTLNGTTITGSGALAIAAGGTAQDLTLDASTSGQIQIGSTSTGDILLGGGSSSTGCTLTNSSGNYVCTGNIVSSTGNINATAGAIQTGGNTRITNGGNLTNIGTISASGAVTAGTYNGQTISSSANFTGTLAVQGSGITLGTPSGGGTPTTGTTKFYNSSGTGSITLSPANPGASNYTLTLPAETGTLCSTASVCTGYAPSSGSGSYIQNGTSLQSSANFNIDGTGKAATLNATSAIQLNGTNINTGGTLSNVAYLDQSNTFTGATNTFSATGGTSLAVTGAPAASATSSLIQIGNALSGGNSNGTYIGLNQPSSSSADLINLQHNGTSEFKVTSGGYTSTVQAFQLTNTSNAGGQILKTNIAGGSINSGDVVSIKSNGTAVVSSTTAKDTQVYGVATSTQLTAGQNVSIAISGNATINVDSAAVNIGDQLVTTATAGVATADNNATTGIVGIALSSKAAGSSGTVSVMVRPVNGQTDPTISGNLTVQGTGTSSFAGNLTVTGTINTATISGGTLSGGTFSGGSVSGGSLSATAVNGLTVSGGIITGGSIASGFGTISTGNNITTTATVQGGVVNATGTLELGGANINTAGTLSNVAYLNQSNTFTGTTNTFSATGGTSLAVTGAPAASATSSLVQLGSALSGGSSSGTYIGINAPTNAADVINYQVAGSSKFSVSGQGVLSTASTVYAFGSGSSAAFKANKPAGNVVLQNYLLSGDANSSFQILGDGTLGWGAGGASALDTNLYRSAASTLKTDNSLVVAGTLAVQGSGITLGTPSGGGTPTTGTTKFYNSSGTGSITLSPANPGASNYTLTLPAETGTLCSTASVCTGYAPSSGSGSYIQNGTSLQSSANFNIDGTGKAATLNATSAIQLNGTNINTGGTLSNVAYKDQANAFTNTNSINTNSTTAFKVEQSGVNDNTLVVDTTNGKVGIGGAPNPTFATLQVAGGIAISTGNLNVTTGTIQTAGVTRIGNTGNLLNITTISASGAVTAGTYNTATISGGTLTATAVNSLNVSGTAISGTGALTVDANGANTVSIGGISTGDILLGGGSSSTGCTVTNATGDLACTGNITGAATGTVGYWSRSGTTLQPSTSGDSVTTSGNISTTGSGTLSVAGTSTFTGQITANGGITSPGSGSNSEHFGAGSSTSTYTNALAVGNGATVGFNYATAIGTSASASGGSSVAVGRQASAASNAVALGSTATASNYSIALGFGATTTAQHQLVIGSDSNGSIQNAYIGNGVTNAVPGDITLHATGGSGTDIAGASLTLAGGIGTGAGNGGNINFQIAKPGTTGSSLNSLSTVFSLSGSNGAALFQNAADSTTAFQIQDSAGTANLFVADTSNGRIGIGTTPTISGIKLYVSGNELVQSSSTSTATLEAKNISSGPIFKASNSTATVFQVGNSGAALFENSADSTAAFDVQNHTGGSQLKVDTTNSKVIVGANQFTNNGSTLNSADSLSDFPTGGAIGTAAATVDSHTSFAIAQTTAGQTLSLPSPTDTTAGRTAYVFNTGTTSFTMGGVTIQNGYGQIYIWNGSSWILGASGGGSAITLQSAYDGGNTITTSNARDLQVTLANTASDGNFIINAATGSTGQFEIQRNGSNTLTIDGDGNLTSVATLQGATVNATSAFQLNGTQIVDSSRNLVNIGTITTSGAINGATISGGTLSGGTVSGGSLDASTVNGLSVSGGTINNPTISGTVTGSGSPSITGFGTISAGTYNSQTISSAANFTGTLAVQGSGITLGTPSGGGTPTTGTTKFYNSSGTGSITLSPANPSASNYTLTLPAETGTLCSTASVCTGYAPSTGGNYIAKNGHDTSSASYLGNLLDLTNTNTGAAGVLSLTSAGTNSALNITQTGNPTSGQALILANNNATVPSGNLLDLQNKGTSELHVDVSGNVTTLGGITLGSLGTNDTNTVLCRNSTNQIASCSGTGSGAPFVQGGNSFGAQAVLGTNDANSLAFETGNTTRAVLDTSGNLQFQQATTVSTSTGTLTLQGASGTVSLGTSTALTSSGALGITAGSTLTLQSTSTSAVSLDSGTTGAVNIGTGANAKTITIGNGSGATSVVINDGTGALNIGTNAIAHTITLGNSTGATSVVVNCGTGACSFGNNAIAHTTTVGSTTGAATTTVQGGTGGINIGTNNVAQTIQIGNTANAVAQTINIGNNATASSTNNVVIGSTVAGSTTLQNATSIALNAPSVDTNATTVALFNTTATTLNIGGAVGAGGINLAGGSSSSGCTINGSTGDLACSGNITGAATGTVGYWSRSGTTLQPATAGDAIITSGNISTTSSGTITSAGLLTGSAGLTVTGGTANINASGTGATNIGSTGSGGAVAIQSASTIALTSGTTLGLTSTGANAININPGGTSNTGVVVQPASDSTAAFAVKNAANTASVLAVDTTHITVGVGTTPASTIALDVWGGSSNLGQVIDQSSSNTSSLLTLRHNGTDIANLSSTGNTFSLDSSAAFKIQNSSSQALFTANTNAQQVAIGPASVPANGVLTVGTNTTAASGGIYFGTDTNLYRKSGSELATDSYFHAYGGIEIKSGQATYVGASSTEIAFQARVSGDSQYRYTVDSSGKTTWGPGGSTAGDVQLARGGVGSLILKPTTGNDSTAAFQIQNASGTALATADTSNTRLNVVGDVNVGTRFGNRLFSDDFESGSFGFWDKGTTGAVSIDSTTVHDGKYAAKVNAAGSTAYAKASLTASSTVYARSWVYVSSKTTTDNLMTIGDSTVTNAWDVYLATGDSKVHLYNDVVGADAGSGGTFTTGAWHLIEMRITTGAGTGTSQVWLDGTQVVNVSSQNNGANPISTLEIGENTGSRTHTDYFDDVAADTATTGTASSLGVDDSLHVGGSASFGNSVLIQSTTNSTQAFQIQNASAQNVLVVDTTNRRVGIGDASAAPDAALSVKTASQNAVVNIYGVSSSTDYGVIQVSSSGNLTNSSNRGLVLQPNAGNVAIGTTPTSNKLEVQGASGVTIGLSTTTNLASDSAYLQVNNRARFGYSNGIVTLDDNGTDKSFNLNLNGHTALQIQDTGATQIQTATDTTNAFQILDHLGGVALNVDTTSTNDRVGIGAVASASAKLYVTSGSYNVITANGTGSNDLLHLQSSGTDVAVFTNAGQLQLADTTGSTSAGIQFGGDTLLYRANGSTLSLGGNDSLALQSGQLVIGSNSVNNGEKIQLYRSSTSTDNSIYLTTASGTDWAIGQGTGSNDLSFWNDDLAANTVYFYTTGNVQFGANVPSATFTADIGGTGTTRAICHSGTASQTNDVQFVDCTGTPSADYAENYPVAAGATYGDIVATGSNMIDTYGTDASGNVDYSKNIGQITQLVKSGAPYQSSSIGIISDNNNDFSSVGYNIKSQDNPMPVALNGRVPVNVSASSEPIQPGDYLTTSGDAGKAMKATGAGFVIGKALAAWDPASGSTQVMVFVEPGYWPGPSQANNTIQNGGDATLQNLNVTGTANFANLNISGTATIHNLTVTGSANIADLTAGTLHVTSSAFFAGDITVGGHIITSGGQPTAQAQTAIGTGAAVSVDGTDTTGTITITTGSAPTVGDLAKILFSKTYGAAPHVVLSPSNGAAAGLHFYKGSTNATDFMFDSADAPAANTTYTFDYFIAQ